MQRFRFITLLLTALFCGLPCIAYSYDLQIVAIDNTDTTKHIIEDLRKRIPSAQLLTDPSKYPKNKNSIYLTIGPAALRAMLAQGFVDGVIISSFTSSQVVHSILEAAPESHKTAITAIYAEPSPVIQMRLISMLYKKTPNVAVILSSKTAYLESIYQNAATQTHTELTIEKLVDGDNLNHVLNRLSDVLVILAIPDSNVFNQDSFRNILITSYRRNQSVIGFSTSFVKAGALASSYSSIEDIDAQVDELITTFTSTGKLPDPQFPKYFSTLINEDVARSLNIVVSDSVKKFSRKPGGG